MGHLGEVTGLGLPGPLDTSDVQNGAHNKLCASKSGHVPETQPHYQSPCPQTAGSQGSEAGWVCG